MTRLLNNLWSDERGFVVSSELAMVSTLGVLGLTTGLAQVAGDVDAELKDVGGAVASLDQSINVMLPNGNVIRYVDARQSR